MKMANRDRQRIGRIVRFGNRGQRKQHAHHLLNLLLLGIAIAGDGLLHQARRILTAVDQAVGSWLRQRGEAPGAGDGADAFVVEECADASRRGGRAGGRDLPFSSRGV